MLSESSCKDLLQYFLSAKESSCQDFQSHRRGNIEKQFIQIPVRSVVLFLFSFVTQRHPQTKTNITDRNDGLIDGTKSRSRWDFEQLKDFMSTNSFTAIESPERLLRQLLVQLNPTKIWLRKTCIFSYTKIWRKAAQAVDLDSLLRFPLHWNVLEVSAAISKIADIFSYQGFAFLNALIDVEGSLFKKNRLFHFFFLNQCFRW